MASDIKRIAGVTEPMFSPDGHELVYTVTVANIEADVPQSDLWRENFDGL